MSIGGRRRASALALVVAVASVTAGLLVVKSRSSAPAAPATLPGELTGRPPWPRNVEALHARLRALGLPALSREGTAFHIHVHLDVFVIGRRVTVPAAIGIARDRRFISPLHTHDGSGVVHVESPDARPFTLGQFFGVWGVRFGHGCLGGSCAAGSRSLRVYVNGNQVEAPARVVLAEHEEIVVSFGTPRQLPRPVPTHYAFPNDL